MVVNFIASCLQIYFYMQGIFSNKGFGMFSDTYKKCRAITVSLYNTLAAMHTQNFIK